MDVLNTKDMGGLTSCAKIGKHIIAIESCRHELETGRK
jgi:hypothetical protein